MTEDVRYTLEEAIALKKRLVDERETDYQKRWNFLFIEFDQVAAFLNSNPPSEPGEALVSR